MKAVWVVTALATITMSNTVDAVKDNSCVVPQSSIGISMLNAMDKEMKIDISTVLRDKTETELVTNEPVSHQLVEQFAIIDEKQNPNMWLSVKDYINVYSESNARNLIVKFTFENTNRQHNVFLASALVNDNECSVRFNGYIIVKRDF
ncbi:Shiga toxin A subunit [Cedecea neteri]|uniref:Shiga toxin A subunit n=1 Tax=Cedecea neteri TaxID=158822 RepID=UPI0028935CE8|nr:Shiga toxin A subunit [Cedecea neteri]WNJ78656.1 Shiga toxin A subunit [Cedecea neteri]